MSTRHRTHNHCSALLLFIRFYVCYSFSSNLNWKPRRNVVGCVSCQQDKLDSSQTEQDVHQFLVQLGLTFDSYRRRFDFGGFWQRKAIDSVGVVEYLHAHGLNSSEAERQAERPYHVKFERERVTRDGITFLVIVDGGRRITTYKLGDWNETIQTNSTSPLFGNESIIRRRTYWKGYHHVTESFTSNGSKEVTVRYLEDNLLVVERIFQRINSERRFISTEYFERRFDEEHTNIFSSKVMRVPGCIATVELCTSLILSGNTSRVKIDGEADSMISRGMLALLSQEVGKMSLEDFLSLDRSNIADLLGLRQVLSYGRNDGLASMTQLAQSQLRSILLGTDKEEANVSSSFNKKGVTVALLLSGGVDSSVALNLLKKQSYDVTAFYLKIWLEDELAHLGQCPWEDDVRMCEAVCAQAGVPLEIISLQQQYKDRVISYTISEATKGRTPNPDIMCNSRIKFGCFYEAIGHRGFDFIATGHYAQIHTDEITAQRKLLRAPDPVKDQSYFLCSLTQEQLQKVIFPIGNLQKSEVRNLAEEFDLPNKGRPDSQGLCFLGKLKFDDFLCAYLGERPGDIVDAANGEILGKHKGVWYHTIGQRKGIGKSLNPRATSRGPWYVVSKDTGQDLVYVSNEYEEEKFTAARTNVFIEDINWVSGYPPSRLYDADNNFCPALFQMKVRHGPNIVLGSLCLNAIDAGKIYLEKKDGGLAPGQFIALYEIDNLECLGGGIISEKYWVE
jgi:tRNA-5-taurinomethyluridine 2-sulfurtransferase